MRCAAVWLVLLLLAAGPAAAERRTPEQSQSALDALVADTRAELAEAACDISNNECVNDLLYRVASKFPKFSSLYGDSGCGFLSPPEAARCDAQRGTSRAAWAEIGTNLLVSILRHRGWPYRESFGPAAEHNAWQLLRMVMDPQLRGRILVRMLPRVAADKERAEQYAARYDELALAERRPQRYGTYSSCNGQVILLPTEDFSRLQQRRAEIGLGPSRNVPERAGTGCY